MKGQQRVKSPKEGTVYIISVSGTKMYAQGKHDYTEVGMTNVATYQVLDIQISGNISSIVPTTLMGKCGMNL